MRCCFSAQKQHDQVREDQDPQGRKDCPSAWRQCRDEQEREEHGISGPPPSADRLTRHHRYADEIDDIAGRDRQQRQFPIVHEMLVEVADVCSQDGKVRDAARK